MAQLTLGPLSVTVTPVAVMKCFVGLQQWVARGSPEALAECRLFRDAFFPYLMGRPDDEPIDWFCACAVSEIRRLERRYGLSLQTVIQFMYRLRNTLESRANQEAALWYALTYDDWLQRFAESPYARLGEHAAQLCLARGIQPFRPALGAAASFGPGLAGTYVPALCAIAVQLDAICGAAHPELNFLETLLHEQVHAAVHAALGDDVGRRELAWLNELAAVLSSQAALLEAAEALGDPALRQEAEACVAWSRSQYAYSDLALACLRDTGAPWLPWLAWQQVFDLPPAEQRNYATCGVITPILSRLGWPIQLPYSYGDRYVTGFVHRV
ncbi:MAG: hypothetical protein HGA45_19990 [Chloroflexales bacterium]|nr:hypothetical protein [Chloroflexales bacterium]